MIFTRKADMAFAHLHLAEAALAAAWVEGQTLSLAQAVAYVLADQ